jgi:hypothetical protein
MSRDASQTVKLPVLVSTEERETAGGWGICFPALKSAKFRAVGVAKPEQIRARLRRIFPPKEMALFVAANQLRHAYYAEDVLALQQSLETVRRRMPSVAGGLHGLGSGRKPNWAGVRRIYSRLMNNLLQDAWFAVWWSKKTNRFLAGVYCPDWKTAAFVAAFMEEIRVCPKCNNAFVPRFVNQDYCTPAHGVAYRVTRFRWKARLHSEEKRLPKKKHS